MKNNLVDDLVSEHTKRKKYNPYKVFISWVVSITICLAIGFIVLGIQKNWKMFFMDPYLIIQNIFLIIVALSSALFAFFLSVPGHRISKKNYLLIFPFLVWLVFLVIEIIKKDDFLIGYGLSCIYDILVMGCLPGVVLFLLIKKGAILNSWVSALLLGISASTLGAWAIQFTCHNSEPFHFLIWHFLPIFIISIFCSIIGKLFIKRL